MLASILPSRKLFVSIYESGSADTETGKILFSHDKLSFSNYYYKAGREGQDLHLAGVGEEV